MGLFSGIKKVFKKVGKFVLKVAPIALAGAAIIFSGGAALGLAPLGIAGGWGAAAASLGSSLGLTGAAASVFTGALTNAGFGAALGGLASGLTGGSISKGAGLGALGGAITGGVTGALGATGAAGANVASQAAPVAGPLESAPIMGPTAPASGVSMELPGFAVPRTTAAADLTLGAAGPSAAPAAAGAEGGLGGFLSANPELVGNTIGGIGKGLLQGFAAKEEQKYLREEQDRRTGSYDVDFDGLSRPGYDTTGNPAPSTPLYRTYRPSAGKRRYEYDPASMRIREVVR